MEKFDSQKHGNLTEHLPFSYFSTNVHLDFAAYIFERNGEQLIVQQDILYPNDFPSIFLPHKKENWANCSVLFTSHEDREHVKKEGIPVMVETPVGSEFFYSTDDFVNPKGNIKNRINKFSSSYEYSLKNTWDKEGIISFYNFWKKQRTHESFTFGESEEFFMFCLNNLEKQNIQQVYVEIEDKLAGLAWGVCLKDNWVGLHLKVDYQYTGLSRFLHSERAKLFSECEMFSLGTGAHDLGIESYKEDLGPIKTINYAYILTGSKI